jgi:hypothetical protein
MCNFGNSELFTQVHLSTHFVTVKFLKDMCLKHYLVDSTYHNIMK